MSKSGSTPAAPQQRPKALVGPPPPYSPPISSADEAGGRSAASSVLTAGASSASAATTPAPTRTETGSKPNAFRDIRTLSPTERARIDANHAKRTSGKNPTMKGSVATGKTLWKTGAAGGVSQGRFVPPKHAPAATWKYWGGTGAGVASARHRENRQQTWRSSNSDSWDSWQGVTWNNRAHLGQNWWSSENADADSSWTRSQGQSSWQGNANLHPKPVPSTREEEAPTVPPPGLLDVPPGNLNAVADTTETNVPFPPPCPLPASVTGPSALQMAQEMWRENMRPPGMPPMQPPAAPCAASPAVPKPSQAAKPSSSRPSSTDSTGSQRLWERAQRGITQQAAMSPPPKPSGEAWRPSAWRQSSPGVPKPKPTSSLALILRYRGTPSQGPSKASPKNSD